MFRIYKYIIYLSIFLVSSSVYSHTELIDSMNIDGYKNADSQEKVSILNYKILELAENEPAIAYELAQFNNDYAQKKCNASEIALTFNALGIVQKNLGLHQEGLASLFKEKAILDDLGDMDRSANNLRDIGEAFRAIYDYDLAFKYLDSALILYKKLDDKKGLMRTFNRLGAVFYEIYNRAYEGDSSNTMQYILKTIDYTNKSLKMSLTLNDSSFISNNYNILGATYNNMNKDDSSLFCYHQSIKYIKNEIDYCPLYNNLANYFMKRHIYDSAIVYAKQAYSKAFLLNNNSTLYFASDILSNAYYKIGEHDSSHSYGSKARNYQMIAFNAAKRMQALRSEMKYKDAKQKMELESQARIQIYILIFSLLVALMIIFILVFVSRKNSKLNEANIKISNDLRIIEKQKEELSLLNENKDKFMSIIAHDLKNPLGSIKQLIIMLLQNYAQIKDNERLEVINDINKTAQNLYSLLENLLTWSKSQGGRIEYNPNQVFIKQLVESNTSILSTSADIKNIVLVNNVDADIIVDIDAIMINTVLRNLITNAIKFTPNNGRITIRSSVVKSMVKISIIDTGIGLSEDDLEKLFRIDISHTTIGTNSEKGTGLGLILCKEFVEYHGGQILVESKIGEGSNFSFTLPLAKGVNK